MKKTKNKTLKWIYRIYYYLENTYNYKYLRIPKKYVLISDITNVLKIINNEDLIKTFFACRSVDEKLELFYNYINTGRIILKTSKIKSSKIKFTPQERKICPSWVKTRIETLEDNEKWRALRYQALKAGKGKCCLCGRSSKEGVILHVDHIKPKTLYPELRYEITNLQVLCDDCNLGKCNFDDTDWR